MSGYKTSTITRYGKSTSEFRSGDEGFAQTNTFLLWPCAPYAKSDEAHVERGRGDASDPCQSALSHELDILFTIKCRPDFLHRLYLACTSFLCVELFTSIEFFLLHLTEAHIL